MDEVTSVTRFREYLRIDTMQPNPDYKTAEVFLRRYSDELGLEFSFGCVFQPENLSLSCFTPLTVPSSALKASHVWLCHGSGQSLS